MRRSGEIARIEGFSDAVFGFAVTLLVVSLEVPKTFGQLMESLRGFGGFAAAFAVLFVIWTEQNRFFRRYGLEDGVTLWLNALLLFLVVLFVYPLKFLFSWLFRQWTGGEGAPLATGEPRQLMMIYAAGYFLVFTVFLLMHWRAYASRRELELEPGTVFDARASMIEMGVQVAIGALSFALAAANLVSFSGLVYILIGPALTINGMWLGKRRRLFLAAAENRTQ